MVVRAGTQSGPVTVESVCVTVPATAVAPDDGVVPSGGVVAAASPFVGVVPFVGLVGVVGVLGVGGVVGVVGVGGVVGVAAVPLRFTAPPHTAAVPVFVTTRSVTTSVTPAGTVNAVAAVVPAGTSFVISTMFCTVTMPVAPGTPAAGVVAIGVVVVGVVDVGVVVDGAVVVGVVVVVPFWVVPVVFCATTVDADGTPTGVLDVPSWLAAVTPATTATDARAANIVFIRGPPSNCCKLRPPRARNPGAIDAASGAAA
jgi:hypothetical protein